MAKIYETPDDLQRDVLQRQRQQVAVDASGSFANAPIFFIVGGLSHMLRQAMTNMNSIPESKLLKIFGSSSLLKAIEWTGYVFSAKSLVEGIILKNKENKTKHELSLLPGKEKIIVKEKDGSDQIIYDGLTDTSILMKNNDSQFLGQAVTTIDASTIHAERMQNSVKKNNSL